MRDVTDVIAEKLAEVEEGETRRPITQQQAENICLAIDRAQDPGQCRYESAGMPCCVIGQLAAVEGATPLDLAEWDLRDDSGSTDIIALTCNIEARAGAPRVDALDGYPLGLLSELQGAWDNPDAAYQLCDGGIDAEGVRGELRLILLKWPKVEAP